LCATSPEKPIIPSTTVVTNYVILNWEAPVDNGSPITGYKVYIRKADFTFIVDPSVCDGLDYLVMQNTQCIVLLDKLTSQPYNLMLGYSIQIKVIATNAYGDSEISEAGNGDIIVLVPDPVINLLNNPTITSDSVIGISWTDGLSNGGKEIIDYRISYD
jgi:hypothetical protein